MNAELARDFKKFISSCLVAAYQVHAPHEAEPVAAWLESLGIAASVLRYPLNTRHPGPLNAVRAEIAARGRQAAIVGVVGFSAGGHLAGQAALASERGGPARPDFALLGYAITSMETETYKLAQDLLLGPGASGQLRRQTSLDRLAHRGAPPFFIWHTAEDSYVPPEHSYRLAAALAAHKKKTFPMPCMSLEHHAYTNAELVAAARAQIAGRSAATSETTTDSSTSNSAQVEAGRCTFSGTDRPLGQKESS